MYDILSYHDSKWKSLYKKVDDIHSFHTSLSDGRQESLFHSIRDMKQDIFNLSSMLLDNHDESIKVQIHDSSKEDLSKELGDLRLSVNKMALMLEKLASSEKTSKNIPPKNIKSNPQIEKKV